jgi:hypothetical protein
MNGHLKISKFKRKVFRQERKLSDSKWSHLCPAHHKAIKAKKLKRVVHKHDYLIPMPDYLSTGQELPLFPITHFFYSCRRNPDVPY